jgi:hypothetical protein
MKTTVTVFLAALALIGVTRAAEVKTEAVLFAHGDYRFVVTSLKTEPAKIEKKKRVSLTISYDVPKNARFILFISSRITNDPMEDTLAYRELHSTPKGEEKIEFESDVALDSFYVVLWRGVGGGSPSGIVCDGAVVSFPLKVTSVVRHEK